MYIKNNINWCRNVAKKESFTCLITKVNLSTFTIGLDKIGPKEHSKRSRNFQSIQGVWPSLELVNTIALIYEEGYIEQEIFSCTQYVSLNLMIKN